MAARKKKAPSQGTCVLYDPVDGSILHTHTVVVLGGKASADPKAVEKEARAALAGMKHHQSDVKALHVAPAQMKDEADYRVDPARRRLQELPPRRRTH